MSDLTEDAFRETMVRVNALVNPWLAFVGLIALHRSPYCARGVAYAVDPSRTGYPDLGQQFVIHPDDVEPARNSVAKWFGGQRPSDDQLAAWLYWHAMQGRTK